MNAMVALYGLYLVISAGFTIWVARTLHQNGRAFLVEAFGGNEPIADSVNHLLVVGFYLINFGYITLVLKENTEIETVQQVVEFLSTKVGYVLLVLGGMHFFNLWIFSKLRRKAMLQGVLPPLPAVPME